MSLLARVQKLEKRSVKPFNPVFVIFQQANESYEKVVNRAKSENQDGRSNFIVVKFVKPEDMLVILSSNLKETQ